MTRKSFIFTLVCILAMTALVSVTCAAKQVDIEVWSSGGINPEAPTALGAGMKAALERFRELHPDINLKWNVQVAGAGQTPEAMQKLMTAIAAGNPPDVTILDRFLAASWAARGAIQSIDKYLSPDTPLVEDNMPPGAWDELVGLDGKLYGSPVLSDNTGFWSLYYNRDHFRRVGMDENSPPTTWVDLITAAKKLTKYGADGEIEILGYRPYGDWAGELNGLARTNQARFVSDDGKTILLDSDEVVETVEFIVKIVDELGGIDKVSRFLSAAQPGAQDPFVMGDVAMYHMGEWFLVDMARFAPDVDFDVTFLPTPSGSQFTAWIGGWAWTMPAGVRNPRESVRVIEYLASREFVEAFVEGAQSFEREMGRAPVLPGALYFVYNDIAKTVNLPLLENTSPNVAKALDHFVTARDRAYAVYAREKNIVPAELWAAQGRALEAALYHQSTPYDALHKETEKLQKTLDDFLKRF